MADVFLSYASGDRDRIAQLVRELEGVGLSVWWDSRIRAGSSFDREIQTQLDLAKCVLVVWSKLSVDSDWVREEAQEGTDRNILVPARIDDCRLPIGFRRIQTLDLSNWPEDRGQLSKLVSRVMELVQAEEAPLVVGNADDYRSISSEIKQRRRWSLPFAIALILVLGGGWLLKSYLDLREARAVELWAEETILRVEDMIGDRRFAEAYQLVTELQQSNPEQPEIDELVERTSSVLEVITEPPGAQVAFRPYAVDGPSWTLVGEAPVTTRVPHGPKSWRFVLDGYREQIITSYGSPSRFSGVVKLQKPDVVPDDMVYVNGGTVPLEGRALDVPSFYIDRLEVSNAAYQAFVDAGGYKNSAYWEGLEFVINAQKVDWEIAMQDFVDSTGRSGPSTWLLGRFPDGTADLPVSGVSWYEAMAYAKFIGKAVPTIAHWEAAAFDISPIGIKRYDQFVDRSNFEGDGPLAVGISRAIARVDALDLFGNVREWALNRIDSGRAIVGGSWKQYGEIAWSAEAAPAGNRSEMNGIRLASYDANSELETPVHWHFDIGEPVSDEAFQLLLDEFAYVEPDLDNVRVVPDVVESVFWRRETADIPLTEDDFLTVHIFVPKSTSPPYQVVLYGPGVGPVYRDEFKNTDPGHDPKYVVRSGRVLVYPEYFGTYGHKIKELEGSLAAADPAAADRLRILSRRRDMGATIDYIQSRQDLAGSKIAYLAFSESAGFYLPLLAAENRIKAAVLVSGGLDFVKPAHPLVNAANFLSRIKLPVLMISGEYDGVYPYQTKQRPLFERLGTPSAQKVLLRLDAGHSRLPQKELMMHVTDWLDSYLGTVAQ